MRKLQPAVCTGAFLDSRRTWKDMPVPEELEAARYQLVRSAVAACACSVAWAAVAGVA
jgi:hypothetical protein